MGLDTLLATIGRRAADTLDTSCTPREVSAEAAPIKACTPDTRDTPEKNITPLDTQREAMRQKAIAMLEAEPDTQRAVYVDDESDPVNVVLCVAIRHPTGATCEMQIPKAAYDPWRLLELVERLGQKIH